MFIIDFLYSWSPIEGVIRRKAFIRCFCDLAAKLGQLGLEKQAPFIEFERMIACHSIEYIIYDSSIQAFLNEVIIKIS